MFNVEHTVYDEDSNQGVFTIKNERMSFFFNGEDLKDVEFEPLSFTGAAANGPASTMTIKQLQPTLFNVDIIFDCNSYMHTFSLTDVESESLIDAFREAKRLSEA